MSEPAFDALGQIYLSGVTRNHGTRPKADARQKHFHLLRRRVLCLVKNHKRIVERPSAHKGKRRNLDDLLFDESLRFFKAEQIEQGIVERAQIRIDLLHQIPRQKNRVVHPLQSQGASE